MTQVRIIDPKTKAAVTKELAADTGELHSCELCRERFAGRYGHWFTTVGGELVPAHQDAEARWLCFDCAKASDRLRALAGAATDAVIVRNAEIRRLRLESCWSLRSLAKLVGVTPPTIDLICKS